jgi:hypothetical protein
MQQKTVSPRVASFRSTAPLASRSHRPLRRAIVTTVPRAVAHPDASPATQQRDQQPLLAAQALLLPFLLPSSAAADNASTVDAAASAAGLLLPPAALEPVFLSSQQQQQAQLLSGLARRLGEYSGWAAYGASVGIVCALLVEVVPLIALSRKLSLRQSLKFSGGAAGACL